MLSVCCQVTALKVREIFFCGTDREFSINKTVNIVSSFSMKMQWTETIFILQEHRA